MDICLHPDNHVKEKQNKLWSTILNQFNIKRIKSKQNLKKEAIKKIWD
jgi:uncharacterized protein YpbB